MQRYSQHVSVHEEHASKAKQLRANELKASKLCLCLNEQRSNGWQAGEAKLRLQKPSFQHGGMMQEAASTAKRIVEYERKAALEAQQSRSAPKTSLTYHDMLAKKSNELKEQERQKELEAKASLSRYHLAPSQSDENAAKIKKNKEIARKASM